MEERSHYIFAEKYRPKTLDTYIGNDHLKEKVSRYIQSGDVPHLLLFGKAGVGKCLSFDEDIIVEIELTEEEYQKMSRYSIEMKAYKLKIPIAIEMKIYRLKIPIGELFTFLDIDNKLYNAIQSTGDRLVKIKTKSGNYSNINAFIKKQGYIRKYEYDGGYIECDEKHRVKQQDNSFSFINDTDHVMVNGERREITNKYNRYFGDVYDIAIDYPHEYITASGVESHNTSLAKIIVNSIDCDYIYINASDERNIDNVRVKIKNFAASAGFKPLKVIILDECLDENTLVTILRNDDEVQIPIKDVDEKNDLVKSWNVKKKEWQWRPFYLWDKGEQEVYEIKLENDEVIVCTEDHKWYVEDKNGKTIIVKTKQLEKYNHILSPYEDFLMKKIEIKSIKKLEQRHHVYDLSVEGNHNFTIGRSKTLTHNCDHMTGLAMAALRNLMETFSRHTRFILTCNYVERIIDPIRSRCQAYKIIPPSKKDVALHLKEILETENIEFDLDDIAIIINSSYPDIRQIINSTQRQVIDNKLLLDTSSIIQNNYKLEIIELLGKRNSFNEIRQLIADNSVSDYSELYRLLYDEVNTFTDNRVAECILAIAEGQYRESQSVDHEICFMSTIINILNILER